MEEIDRRCPTRANPAKSSKKFQRLAISRRNWWEEQSKGVPENLLLEEVDRDGSAYQVQHARIIIMARRTNLQLEAGYICADCTSSNNLSLQSGGVTIHSGKLALSDDTNKLTN
jgi:hypothetical protein